MSQVDAAGGGQHQHKGFVAGGTFHRCVLSQKKRQFQAAGYGWGKRRAVRAFRRRIVMAAARLSNSGGKRFIFILMFQIMKIILGRM
jgi:hypothetical protein